MLFFLFTLFFSLRLINLVSKSAFVTKFTRANLASKTSSANLFNSGVVIYLSDYDRKLFFFQFH